MVVEVMRATQAWPRQRVTDGYLPRSASAPYAQYVARPPEMS